MLRMMRRARILDALISRTKQQILAATLLQPERSWYLLELARHLGVRPSSLQRELRRFTESGILKRYQNGNRVYFQAELACPIRPELALILAKTVGVVDVIKEALTQVQDRIEVAFVYGSVAASSERPTSDIDLMVIGAVSLSEVATGLPSVQEKLGRAVNPTVYGLAEFRRRVQQKAHFLKTVLGEEKLFVIGSQDDLAKITAKPKDKSASHQPAGTQRPARRR
jgi:DNA-binding transcriptional ArsR family regulator